MKSEIINCSFLSNVAGAEQNGNAIFNRFGALEMRWCRIVDNDINAASSVKNSTNNIEMDALYNWWGATDGPAGVGSGSGDAVSLNIAYEPYLTSNPNLESDWLGDGCVSCEAGLYEGDDNETSSNPISLRKGEKRVTATDLSVNTPVGSLAFTRYYRQNKREDMRFKSILGLGWTHNHVARLQFTGTAPNRTAEVVLSNGSILKLAEDGSNHFEAQAGSNTVLGYDTNEYVLKTPQRDEFVFGHLVDGLYRLERHTRANGEIWTYVYPSDTSHKLLEVNDGYGRGLKFAYVDNPNEFNDGLLWRVGDQDTTGLDTGTPVGRYVEFTYITEKSNGQEAPNPRALLAAVHDVRGYEWLYDYYGQHAGQTAAATLNFLTDRFSPMVDTTGDGTADERLTLEHMSYEVSGAVVTAATQERANAGLTEAFVFHPQGNQTITRETVAGKTTVHRFGRGVYIGSEDPAGNYSLRVPDEAYRPQMQQDANGNRIKLAWSGDGKLLNQVSDALGHQTGFDYAETADVLLTSVDAEGNRTEYTYGASPLRQPTVVKVFKGTTVLRWQTFTYDNKGRTLTEVTLDPTDGQTVLRRATRTYYSSDEGNGLLEKVVQEDLVGSNDVETTSFYDSIGRVVQTNQNTTVGSCTRSRTVYDAAGNVVATICNYVNVGAAPTNIAEAIALFNPMVPDQNRVTTYEYDALGRRIQTTTNAGANYARTALTVYDALNRVRRTIANYVPDPSVPNPYTTLRSAFNALHGPDNNQNLVTDTSYNERGQVKTQTDVLGNVTLYGYDDAGRLVRTVQNSSSPTYDNAYTTGDPDLSDYSLTDDPDKDIITVNEYDAAGNLVRTVAASGRESLTIYDALNRPVKVVENPKVGATYTLYPFDLDYEAALDLRSDEYSPAENPAQDLIQETNYDAMGRVVQTRSLVDARGEQAWTLILYVYDAAGRQVRTIANYVPQGNSDPAKWVWVTNHWERSASDPTPIVHGANNDQNLITEVEYDEADRVLHTIDSMRSKIRSVYDGLGRQVKTIANYVEQGTPVTDPTNWVWDEADKRWERGINDNTAIVHGSGNDQNLISATVYNTDGRVESVRDVEGKLTRYVYDDLGRQVKTIANYVPQEDSDPANWAWENNRWEYSIGDPVQQYPVVRYSDPANLANHDQNVITETTYDAQGRVLKTRDARGNLMLYGYDSSGRQVKTIQNASNESYDVNSDPDLSDYTPASGAQVDQDRVTSTAYDLAGRVFRTIDPAGKVTRYVFDGLGHRIRVINNYVVQGTPPTNPADWVWDENDGRWEDGAGNPIVQYSDPLKLNNLDQNLISDTTYNKAGQVISTRDNRGTKTEFVYDQAGRRLRLIQAAGSSLKMTSYACYDKAGQLLRHIDSWLPEYDENHRVVSPDLKDSGSWVFKANNHGRHQARNRVSQYTYDGLGRRIQVIDPMGSQTITAYTLDGQVDTVTEPGGTVSLYRYDKLRRRTRVVQGYSPNGEDPAEWVWNGNVTSLRWEKSNGTPILFGEDYDQNIIVQLTYDKVGRVLSQRDPRGKLTQYQYDRLGRRITLTNPLLDSWQTTYTDLPGSSRVALQDPLTHQTERHFDRLGRPKTINYLNESGTPKSTPDVAFTYDVAGNRTAMTEYQDEAHQLIARTTAFQYDDAHRLTKVGFDHDGSGQPEEEVSYQYDVGGLRTRLTLPGELTLAYTYNAQGKLSGLTDWDGHNITYLYDQAGRMVSADHNNGLKYRYPRDLAGRYIRVRPQAHVTVEPNGMLITDLGLYAYHKIDARGNRTEAREMLLYPGTIPMPIPYNHPSIEYYQGSWQADEVNDFNVSTDISASLRLDFLGNEVTLVLGIGPDHGICDVYISGSLWRSFDNYAPSPGERLPIMIPLETAELHTLDIRNRAEKNLRSSGYKLRFKSLTVPQGYDLLRIGYTYDALARLKRADYYLGWHASAPLARQYTYTYDEAGNRTRETVFDGVTTTTTDYEYNDANQLRRSRVNGGAWNNDYAYDANGNLTADGINTYTWDRANRLVMVETPTADYTYQYDGQGNRISQIVTDIVTSNEIVTSYLLDLQPGLVNVLAKSTDEGTQHYLFDPRGVIAQKSGTNTQWMLRDGLGSVRGLLDDTLNIQETTLYSPYGVPFDEPGAFGTPFMFTGEMMDSNGLEYLRARYYNPTLGIFPSLDPVENLNRYQYVNSNPINTVDPSGMCAPPFGHVSASVRLSTGEIILGSVPAYNQSISNFLSCNGPMTFGPGDELLLPNPENVSGYYNLPEHEDPWWFAALDAWDSAIAGNMDLIAVAAGTVALGAVIVLGSPVVAAAGVFTAGYIAYEYIMPHFVDKCSLEGRALNAGGVLLGYESLSKTLEVIRDPNESTERRAANFALATLNTALAINFFQSVANGARHLAAGGLNGDETLARQVIDQEIAQANAKGMRILEQPQLRVGDFSTPFRDGLYINMPTAELSRGKVVHEATHFIQEYGSHHTRGLVRFFQNLSSRSTAGRKAGALLPTYFLNPVEIQAAMRGGNISITFMGNVAVNIPEIASFVYNGTMGNDQCLVGLPVARDPECEGA